MPPPAAQEERIKSFTIAPRLLLAPFGSGEQKCDGNLCASSTGVDYDHKTAFGLGADLLFRVGPTLRLGPGFGYLLENDVEPDVPNASDYTIGSEVDVSFVIDAAIPASPTVWIVPRGQLGVKALIPGGDLRDDLDKVKDSCNSLGASGCDSLEGARPGLQVGVGVGAMFAVGPSVRLRADVMYQYYKINLYTVEALGDKAEVNYSGSRGFLMAGAEF